MEKVVKIDWTYELAENIVEILKSHSSLVEALDEIAEFLNVDTVTGSAVRHGLLRQGFSNPSSYLSKDEQEDEEDDERVAKGGASVVQELYEYRVDFEKREYRFCRDQDRVAIPFETMQQCHFLYSKVKPGQNLTAGDVSNYLYSEGIMAGPDFVQWMFRRIGFSKSMYPAAPHLRFANEEAVAKDVAARQDAVIKSGLKLNQIKEQEKELKELREKNDELVQLLQFKEHLSKQRVDDIPNFNPDVEDNPCVLIIPLGDLHAGKSIKKRMGFETDNSYDLGEFYKRLEMIEDGIIGYADKNAHRVQQVVIHGLGDWFESPFGNLREGIMQTMFGTLEDQWLNVVNAFCRIVRVALDWFDCPVFASYTPGNHDRIHKQKEDNTEYLIGHILTDRIQAEFRNEERFQMRHVTQAITSELLPSGLNVITMHGHVSGIGPTSPDHAYVSLAKLHEREGTKRTLILAGHYHALTVRTFHSGRMIWVPSMCGADSYSREHILKGAPAEFIMIESYEDQDRIVGPFNLQA